MDGGKEGRGNMLKNLHIKFLFPNSQKLYLLFSKSCPLFRNYAQIDEISKKLFMNVEQKNTYYSQNPAYYSQITCMPYALFSTPIFPKTMLAYFPYP